MQIPIIVLGIVFILIAIRQVGKIRLEIWQIMLFGALVVLLSGRIATLDALKSINLDVILFLFGMFVIGRALEDSGYLSHLSYKFFKRSKNPSQLFLFIIFGFGILSSFLMNDTIAIIGTPVVLLLAKKHEIDSKPLLLALAFSVTIGSAMSPIGNPQNLLIAIKGRFPNPFFTFFKYLFVPTLINLFVAFMVLKLFFKGQFGNREINHSQEPIKDNRLAALSKISLIFIFVLVFIKIIFVFFKVNFEFKLTYIALFSMLPIVLFSKKRFQIIKRVDWHTLIFFVAMFVLMESVWETGFFQKLLFSSSIRVVSIPMVFLVSVLLSQLLSNVPLVALYMPLLMSVCISLKEMMALAAGSTIAGNLLILGAASNIIIIQNAEKRSRKTITFLEFAKVGIPLTILNILIYWIFLRFIP